MSSPRLDNSFQRAFRLTQTVLLRSAGGEGAELQQRQAAADDAADSVVDMVRKFLMENYLASGLKTNTGTLKSSIERVEVMARATDRGVKLTMQMPIEPKTHKGQTSSEFFAMAGALNWGAVRFPKSQKKMRSVVDTVTGAITGYKYGTGLGGKAIRSLKKYALTGKISKKARGRLDYGTTISGKHYEGYEMGTSFWTNLNKHGRRKSVKFSGGAIVIEPHPFFLLRPSQERAVAKAFASAFLAEYTYRRK